MAWSKLAACVSKPPGGKEVKQLINSAFDSLFQPHAACWADSLVIFG